MGGSDLKGGAITLFEGGAASAMVAGDGGKHGIDVCRHVWVVGVEGLCVGGFDYDLGFFFVIGASGGIEACEPGLSGGIVAYISDIDVKVAQVSFGVGKMLGSGMGNDEACVIDGLSNTTADLGEAEKERGDDGGGQHCQWRGDEWCPAECMRYGNFYS